MAIIQTNLCANVLFLLRTFQEAIDFRRKEAWVSIKLILPLYTIEVQ